jgi:hypothetical protein
LHAPKQASSGVKNALFALVLDGFLAIFVGFAKIERVSKTHNVL